ncbi:Internalin-A precursor [uncultured Eubacterium sp.]|nr:Internalin-A precursor [uncultured Eubacterium sp.]
MKQKLMSSIGGCLLLAFLLLAFPIRGQAADSITVTDDDNGVKVQYELSKRGDSAGTYSAAISFVDEDATPEELYIKSKVKDANGTSYEIRDIKSVAYKNSLQSVKIEEGITSMDGGAWEKGYANSDTVKISFPSTLEDVEDSFLNWDKHPDSVIVPKWLSKMQSENGVVYAGKVAVYVPKAENDASKVSEITFKDGCTKIAHKALFKNTDVTKVNIPASVKAIGGAAFSGCTELSQVNFAADAQIEDLDWRAFYDCTALTSIKIPDSVTRIGTETFSGCTSLATIDISKESKLTRIEYGAFGYYPYKIDLKSLGDFSDINPSGTLKDGLGVKVKEIYLPKESIKNYKGGSAAGLFAGCTTLEKVTIGSSGDAKAELPYEMFAGCTNLTTVNMDKNVKTIGTAAFAECTGLKSIDLTEVKEVMSYAFTKAGLSEVTIPSSVEKIGAITFGGCISLETMTLESRWSGEDSVYRRMVNILGNFSYVKGEYSYNMHTSSEQVNNPIRSNEEFREKYPGQTAIKTLIIKNDGEGTALDNSSAFAAHLVSLENVTLPEGMKTIPSGAFKQCFSLKKVVLPSSIETIGNNAFDSDVNLDIDFTKLTNLTSIGSQAFSIINANGGNSVGGSYDKKYTDEITDNGGIKNIILSESVKTIGSGAFFGQRNVKKIVIPESVTSIQGQAFQMIPALEELEVYASLDKVSGSSFNEVFWSNTRNDSTITGKLKKVILGESYSATGKIGSALFYGLDFDEIDIQMNNIQNLGSSMFMKNTRLKSFTVPKTVKVINQAAFYETTALKDITIPKNVQTIDVEAFRKSGLEKIWILNKDLVIKEPTTEDVTEEESASKTKVYIYNPKETVEDFIAIPKNVTIYGYAGSTAEAYAQKNGNKFVVINPENKVIFDSVGGSKVEEQTIECGEFAKKPADPAKEGYTFKGWYTNKECTNAFDFDKDSIKEETTLYAKWEKNPSSKPETKPAIKKNAKVTRGKYIYKVTSVTKKQNGNVQVCGFAKGKKAATIVIPSTITINGKKFKVTSIAPKAFLKNKTVKKVVIGNNVKVVGTKAFYNAKKLHTITIGKNVTTIKSQAFGKLPKLKKVVVRSKKLKKLKKIKKKIFKPVKHKFTIK